MRQRREKLGKTQSELAERVGVTQKTISSWEHDRSSPDRDNVLRLAAALDIEPEKLTDGSPQTNWTIRNRMFSETHMFLALREFAERDGLHETYEALPYARAKHAGASRKGNRFAAEPARVPFIIHPLLTACHAYALGIRDDVVLATALLHDVCEDGDVTPEELPFSEPVRTAVGLLTKKKGEPSHTYYQKIRRNATASIVKVLDRCNNISTMANSFPPQKIAEYTAETEKYIIPLLDWIRDQYPQYANASFVIRYHMMSVLETAKVMLVSRNSGETEPER